MKVSSKTEYALKTLMDLAIQDKDEVSRIADIGERQSIPQKFLEQILLLLKAGGIVASKRGVKGGYYLSQSASEITLDRIFRLMGDAISSDSSAIPGRDLSEAALREVWKDIDGRISDKLEHTTILDMCIRTQELSAAGGANYII